MNQQPLYSAYDNCKLCPRQCGALRNAGHAGFCGQTATLRIARAALHYWEEPPISGEAGSGAIFFSGCPLRCIFCQNYEISQDNFGLKISTKRLADIMRELESQGALNINLVTPFHFAPQVREAVMLARTQGLTLPVVCNTSGYECVSTLRTMEECIDIWLTDFKYASSTLARDLSAAPNYPHIAAAALKEMVLQISRAGGRLEDDHGILKRGIIVRHLVLPGCIDDSFDVLDRIWEITQGQVDISIMNQYTPNARCKTAGGDLCRSVTNEEYEAVLDYADALGFSRLWWQQGGTVDESFTPPFDATGVLPPHTADSTHNELSSSPSSTI